MQELEIRVTHRVSPELNTCTYGGDFWEKMYVRIIHTETGRMVKNHLWKGIFPNVCFLING